MRKRLRQRFGVWLRAQLPGHTPAVRSTKEGWLVCPCGRYGFERETAQAERVAAEAVIQAAVDLVTWASEGNTDTRANIIMAGGALKRLQAAVANLDRVRGDGPETEGEE